ncbi:MAG: hypothetical protein DRH37_01225 [Deltaproteobacteria bacterium]|nr:MAG: hypothetical protein DRH37_01225 [Deltaproteobacteria bacterium]
MKLDININENTFLTSVFVCATFIASLLIFTMWDYHTKEIEHFTKNQYEQTAYKGSSAKYWKKIK